MASGLTTPPGTTVQHGIRLARSVVGAAETAALARVIERGYLAMGEEVQAFERELGAFLGTTRDVMCVATGTAALHLALHACDIGPGDEVLVPSLTYIATFQAISATGATPVACDVRPDTAWLDVEDAARRVSRRTKAIMPVHYAGGTGDLDAVRGLADAHGLRVIEDAAQAFGCHYRGTPIGAAGDIVCFSFDGIKNITSGEGGAVVTGDRTVADRIKDARLLAIQKDTDKRYAGLRSWEFDVVDQGWRYHMSNLCAAIGRVQLGRFADEFRPKRLAMAARYRDLFSDVPGVRMLDIDYGEHATVPFSFHVFIEHGRRDEVLETLLAAGIECGIHYKPNHLLTKYGGGAVSLPVAERLHREVLAIPFHPGLTDDDQALVARIVAATLRNG
jgi:dTDP-4-amino-4,6-dideoxygalactose transaminase